jgi:hypothetical protein
MVDSLTQIECRWNRDLIRRRGFFMGREFKGKGVNVALGPMMNMGRVAEGGRNWEGFGADPFLSGEAAYETVLGMQEGGIQACAKHYIDKYVLVFCCQSHNLMNVNLIANKNMHERRLHLMLMIGHNAKFMPIRS